MDYKHIPVMLDNVMQAANLNNGNIGIDFTLGGGSYTMAMSKAVGKTGRVLSIDLDDLAINNARRLITDNHLSNVSLFKGNFRDAVELLKDELEQGSVDAVVMDLGLSSAQLDDPKRGFSFQSDGPLDMSFGDGRKTEIMVNRSPEAELADIILKYGEERHARRIAKAIVVARKIKPIKTSKELVDIIGQSLGRFKHQEIHFATRTFQALRIATNDELKALEDGLKQAVQLLKPGGRLAVVSFHSLEDRIVKNYFRQEAKDCICPPKQLICTCGHQTCLKIISSKPLLAADQEIKNNPRARSAKLRVAEKL